MKRREIITLLGGAAAFVWPLAVRAQQGERMRRIGALLNAAADDPKFQTWVGAFLQTLALLGWTIGHKVRTRSGFNCEDNFCRACSAPKRRRCVTWKMASRRNKSCMPAPRT